jgi:nitrogen fixation/metabolism regulation signal transduction histidine kinase
MKSKVLFGLLALAVFGSLALLGFRYAESHRYLFLFIEGIALLASVLFVALYIRLIKPYRLIADGMELLKEQDFSTRLRPISDSEANKLISVFNKMMDHLKEERLLVREKNYFLDLLIQASPMGVIILDFDEYITDINPAGLKLLNIPEKDRVTGKKIMDSGISIRTSLAKLATGEDIVIRGAGISIYRCVRSAFIDRGFNHPFILIEELTDELLKIEKQSCERVIRMIAHEVNNSAGAIGSTLHVLLDMIGESRHPEFADALPALEASIDRCRHLGRFVSKLAELIKLPEPQKTRADLNELAKSVEALAGMECRQRNIRLTLCLSSRKCMADIDLIQMEQVLVNIVKNAYEAIGQNGEIRLHTAPEPLSLCISNNGPPIPADVAENLFVPFFSTKPSGQGIGLTIVREILRNHGLRFRFYSEAEWTRFEIVF